MKIQVKISKKVLEINTLIYSYQRSSRERKSGILRSIKSQHLPVHSLVQCSLAKTFPKTGVARIALALLFSSVN
jgi:hypothetical protein